MCDTVENCCRICLDVQSEHVSILEDPIIHLHMKSCLAMSITANDELPKKICTPCVNQLREFYNFQLNARCSQDWLETSLQEKKKSETKVVQPLPDSEYNSDSLLEFLNNTENIEEYLNNLGKEDIPSIINMVDKNNENPEGSKNKISPKKNSLTKSMQMEIDVLDSDAEIVKEIVLKEIIPKKQIKIIENTPTCFACNTKFDDIQNLTKHASTCDLASRTCINCNKLFDSKSKMQQHSFSHHSSLSLTCRCGKIFDKTSNLLSHMKVCHMDPGPSLGCVYRCKQCGDIFKERFLLYKHAKKHVIKSEEIVCDLCGHNFIGEEVMAQHRKEVHRLENKSEEMSYRCKVCSFTSTNHREVYLHVQKHLSQKQPRHLCDTCGISFTCRPSLNRHTLQHAEPKYKCNICQKTFKSLKERDLHVLDHTQLVICEKCGQNISTYKLNAHVCE